MSDSPEIQAQTDRFKRLNDAVYELLPEKHPHAEVVFFHGLLRKGTDPKHAFWRTWKMRDSEECWPETLLPKLLVPDQENCNGDKIPYRVRVLSISYENRPEVGSTGTEATDEFLMIEKLIQDLIVDDDAGVGRRTGVPVFLMGHDLGGILIKEFVMALEGEAARMHAHKAKIERFLQNLTSVFFYATPHSGSQAIQNVAAKINAQNANQMLRLMKVLNQHTARINQAFQAYRQRNDHRRVTTFAFFAANETNEGDFKNVVVCTEGTTRNDVDQFHSVRANHFEICQPRAEWTTEVIILAKHMMDMLKLEHP